MFLQVLSHASLLIRHQEHTLLIDPWLVGSCYWRSWWNYPPVDPKLYRDLAPDAIYLTHIHWDHFHGPSLRRFPRTTRLVVPYERSTRMRRDLEGMKFTDILELPHGGSLSLADDFTLTSYQFSLWGDSALVVEGGGVRALNANDAKFMGSPLQQIIDRHAPFTFVFRSHSSANDRACYESPDETDGPEREDPTGYARSFYSFIEKTKPAYAVPFASNHCHLHQDVFSFNDRIQTPMEVERYVASRGGFTRTQLKIMVSGDAWDSENGFHLQRHTYFTEREGHIRQYRDDQREILQSTYRKEERAVVRIEEVKSFFSKFARAVPWLIRRTFKGKPIVFCAQAGKEVFCFAVDLSSQSVTQVAEATLGPSAIRYETSAAMLKMAMALNMFSQIGISKRVRYRSLRADRRYLIKINSLLAAYEYEVLPVRLLFRWRTWRCWARRWREVLLGVRFLYGLRSGRSPHEMEEEFLR